MILHADKPDWSKAFTGATHLLQIPISGRNCYVFAVYRAGDFYHSMTPMSDTYSEFTIIEPTVPKSDYPALDISKIEAEGIRKAVAHLKENHGGDRYSSSAYLNYADNLCKENQ